jgi:hypothetical protein
MVSGGEYLHMTQDLANLAILRENESDFGKMEDALMPIKMTLWKEHTERLQNTSITSFFSK